MELLEKFFKEWGIPILCAVFLAFLVNRFIFFNVNVPTESMYPTIKPRDKIFVTRIHSQESLQRGDIIVFKSEELEEDLIKRLIGLPGDHIEIKADGTMYINGKIVKEDYVVYNSNKEAIFDVPEDCYVFCGDNRNNSLDARYWDNPYINYKDIKGKARFIISPFSRWGKLN
ncbi:signal peptidase I [Clostridium senegalense]|uniref:Signal peptidase I n=1 Tax=Clostridium senegalense TaxID=1465809 RepID=A0A6M0GZM7_9CLOT|nr:signal peptidase I [Clostridium senegalense]NEU03677.1 signal peptidase I [Clostridium senegalense]